MYIYVYIWDILVHDCVNTRDNGSGRSCNFQLAHGNSCENYLFSKDCDGSCFLCACSTASGTSPQHCSGHGYCKATCRRYFCFAAKCICDKGWTGAKCETRGNLNHLILYHEIINIYFKNNYAMKI